MIIGIDFDNTIILYDKVFYNIALELRFIEKNISPIKFLIREKVRSLPDGEMKWRKLQTIVYGKNIQYGEVAPGFLDFIKKCRQKKNKVFIISHKTSYAQLEGKHIDLHFPALCWLQENNFFDILGFKRTEIFFLETREEKLKYIKKLNCDVFIDDLVEVFLESEFPKNTLKILYNPHKLSYPTKPEDVVEVNHFKDVEQILLD